MAVQRIRRRLWLSLLIVLLVLVVALPALLTSAEPWVPQQRTPTAQQVELAQNAFKRARTSRSTGTPGELVLNQADLDSIGALLSQGFAPDRLSLRVHQGVFEVVLSRPVLNRWLNVSSEVSGENDGFPPVRARIGSIPSPAWLTRIGLAIGRRLLILRGGSVPELDTIVRHTRITDQEVHARLTWPSRGLMEPAVAVRGLKLDDRIVARIYCELVSQQKAQPSDLFARHLQRAISLAEPTPEGHGAALVAVAMLVADPRAGEIVGDAMTRAGACVRPITYTTLQGRADLPKHWSLSAALTVSAGSRLAIAMGEWKELADSLSTRAFLATDDPSGFSLVDLAADRAGYLTARQLIDAASLAQARARVSSGIEEQLLPKSTTRREDRLSQADFVRTYGGTDDPRYNRLLKSIDADLATAGIN